MSSPVLNYDTPYHILFQNKPMFPIKPRIFGCTCFVRDVHPHVSKLNPKSLKCIFLGYFLVQKGYRCYCPSLHKYLFSVDVTFLENVPFSSSPTHMSQWKEDDLLVYTLVSPKPALVPTQVKPLITQVYTRHQHPLVLSPSPAASKSDPILSDDLPIALHKGKRQCAHSISSFCSYEHLSSHSCSFIASLDSIPLPNKVSKAPSHPSWRSAMIEEMDALTDNGTWDLVRLPVGKKAIGYR